MFKLSNTLATALDLAGIAPDRLNETFDRRCRKRSGGMIEVDHYPRLLAQATGLVFTSLRRHHLRFLIEISGPEISYLEHGATRCTLMLRGEVPNAVAMPLIGQALHVLADLGRFAPLFATAAITGHLESGLGYTSLAVQPGWKTFQ